MVQTSTALQAALFDDIRDHPDDDASRMALADLLMEQDDPVLIARGDFIRLQCELATLPEDDPQRPDFLHQAAELQAQHEQAWLGGLHSFNFNVGWEFRRGLVQLDIALRTANFEALAATDAWAWVDGLMLRVGLWGDLARFTSERCLGGITTLDLDHSNVGQAGARSLAGACSLTRLATLSLGYNAIGPEGAQALAGAGNLARVRTLGLAGNDLGPEGAWALGATPYLASLRTLDLGHNGIGDQGTDELARSANVSDLVALNLCANNVSDEGAWQLASSPHLARLKSLNLGGNEITAEGAEVLGSGRLASLAALYLWGNTLGDEGARALARSPGLGKLRLLDVSGNRLGPRGKDALRQRFGERVLWS